MLYNMNMLNDIYGLGIPFLNLGNQWDTPDINIYKNVATINKSIIK